MNWRVLKPAYHDIEVDWERWLLGWICGECPTPGYDITLAIFFGPFMFEWRW